MRLSASQIGTYRRCSMQWWFRYVAGLKMKPVANMTKGRAVHKGIEAGYTSKADVGEDPPIELVLEATSDEFDRSAGGTKWEEGEDPGSVKDRSVNLAAMHHAEVMPLVMPALVEHEMHYEITSGVNMIAYADVVTADGAIRDTKTTGRTEKPEVIAMDAQLAAYTLGAEAEGLPVERIHLDRLVDIQKPYVQSIELPRGQVDTDRTRAVAGEVARGIEAGIFVPCDDARTCSWCGYKRACWGQPWWKYFENPDLARKTAWRIMEDDLMP